MARLSTIPTVPKTIRCPFCSAAPNVACKTTGGRKLRNALGIRVAVIHVARIQKAAEADQTE
jgi:hypothetical protein